MAVVDLKKRRIECKIVYYGPARCGKTTNLRYISKAFKQKTKGELVSIETESDQTLFFDFLPVGLGELNGFEVRAHLYTVPGQVRYGSSRKLLLRQADGVIFVADSLEVRREQNIHFLADLRKNLEDCTVGISDISLVLQYNKRDLADQHLPLMTVEEMEEDLNRKIGVPSFPTSAIRGRGVGETLMACLKGTQPALKRLLKETQNRGNDGSDNDGV